MFDPMRCFTSLRYRINLVAGVHAERDLEYAALEDLKTKVHRQVEERTEICAAITSSQAFLGRGFHDIEMLLEAGFLELEDSRTGFMAQQRKRFKAKVDRERMRRARRMGRDSVLSQAIEKDGFCTLPESTTKSMRKMTRRSLTRCGVPPRYLVRALRVRVHAVCECGILASGLL